MDPSRETLKKFDYLICIPCNTIHVNLFCFQNFIVYIMNSEKESTIIELFLSNDGKLSQKHRDSNVVFTKNILHLSKSIL